MNVSELLTQIPVAEKALSEIRNIVGVAKEPMPAISTPEEAQRRAELKLCTICGEPLPEPRPGKKRSDDRGADNKCYVAVIRAIRAGEITDDEAVAWGWLLPAKKGGRPRSPNSAATRVAEARKLMAAQLAKKSKP